MQFPASFLLCRKRETGDGSRETGDRETGDGSLSPFEV